jgi:hypothetical protein
MHVQFWSENLDGRDYSEDLGVDGKVILQRVLRKYGRNVWTGFTWLKIGTSGGPSSSIKGGEFLD